MGFSLSWCCAQPAPLLSDSIKSKAQVRARFLVFFLSPSPFFLMCLANGNVKISLIYIEKCPDHTVFYKHYYELHGEPVVLKCPSPRYKHLDFSALTPNITWYKNGSNTMISGRDEDPRIWANGDALWLLPAMLEDSGVYICTRRWVFKRKSSALTR